MTFDNIEKWVVEFELKVTGIRTRIDISPPNSAVSVKHIGLGKNGDGKLSTYYYTTREQYSVSNNTFENGVYYPCRIEKTGNSIKSFFNNSKIADVSNLTMFNSITTEEVKILTWGTNTLYIKKLKVKPLV